jgi:hypothetical protein
MAHLHQILALVLSLSLLSRLSLSCDVLNCSACKDNDPNICKTCEDGFSSLDKKTKTGKAFSICRKNEMKIWPYILGLALLAIVFGGLWWLYQKYKQQVLLRNGQVPKEVQNSMVNESIPKPLTPKKNKVGNSPNKNK